MCCDVLLNARVWVVCPVPTNGLKKLKNCQLVMSVMENLMADWDVYHCCKTQDLHTRKFG